MYSAYYAPTGFLNPACCPCCPTTTDPVGLAAIAEARALDRPMPSPFAPPMRYHSVVQTPVVVAPPLVYTGPVALVGCGFAFCY